MNLNIICIIPARGGSKRLPNKNIKLLSGKPMIAYSIEAAKKSKYIDKVIVSTDDQTIADVAKKYGAEIPFIRPLDLATDTAKTIDVLKHAVNYIEKQQKSKIDIIVLVQPTVPLLKTRDIEQGIKILQETKTRSCVSVTEISERPEFMFEVRGSKAHQYQKKIKLNIRTQDLKKLYRINGGIYATQRDTIMKKNKIIDTDSMSVVIMPKERSIDIDDKIDFEMAKFFHKYAK